MSDTLEARTIIDLGQQVARLRAALTAAQAENRHRPHAPGPTRCDSKSGGDMDRIGGKMTTTDLIVDEAERLQARVRELEAALATVRPAVAEAVETAAREARRRSFHYDVYGLGPHSAATVNPQAVKALATIDATLTPSEPRR